MPFSCAGAPHAIPVGAVGLRKSNEHLGRQVALALYHIVQTTACVEVVIMIRCLAKVCILCQPSQQSRPKIMPNLQQADAVHPLISRSLIKVRGIQLVPSEHLSLRMYVQPATFLTTSRERRSAGGPTAYHANSRVVC